MTLTVSPGFVDWLKCEETGQDKHGRLLPQGTPSLTAYRCPAGVWTNGWGSTGADIGQGTVWTLWTAQVRIARDLTHLQSAVNRLVAASPTTQGQFDALCGFAYNLGEAALGGSTLLKRHLQRNYPAAVAEFARWNKGHVGGVLTVLGGLTARRADEAGFYRGDR